MMSIALPALGRWIRRRELHKAAPTMAPGDVREPYDRICKNTCGITLRIDAMPTVPNGKLFRCAVRTDRQRQNAPRHPANSSKP
jgi:hypothetical protein